METNEFYAGIIIVALLFGFLGFLWGNVLYNPASSHNTVVLQVNITVPAATLTQEPVIIPTLVSLPTLVEAQIPKPTTTPNPSKYVSTSSQGPFESGGDDGFVNRATIVYLFENFLQVSNATKEPT